MEARISTITLGVSDLERSYRFYKEGLGFSTKMTPDGGIVIFSMQGTLLSLYPYDKLAEDVTLSIKDGPSEKGRFPGFTLAHTVRKKDEVDTVLALAGKAGGAIIKPAQDVFWGGYSGYFADPDGYLWEVNYSEAFKFNADGSLSIE